MQNKTISIFFKKFTHYLSILTIIFGTTFGSIRSANAVDLTANDVYNDDGGADAGTVANPGGVVAFDLKGYSLTFNTAGDGQAAGAITDTGANDGTTASLVITNTNGGGAMTQTIASIIVDGLVTVDMIDDEADLTLTVGSAAADNVIGGALTMTNADATSNEHMIVDVAGSLTVTGATTLIAADGADGGASNTTLIVDKAATFTGGVTLNDDGGKAILEFEQDNAVTIAGDISGASAGEGTIQVTGATKTFSGTIGGTSLREIDIDSAAAFSGTVAATNINIDADVTFASTVTGAIALDTAGADASFAGNVTGAISTSTTTNKIIYNGSSDQTSTGAITAITDGDGIINNTNTSGTVTLATAVGTALKRYAEIDSDASTKTTFSAELYADLVTLDGTITLTQDENDTLDINLGANSKLIIAKSVTNTQNLLNAVGTAFSVTSGAKLYAPINLKDGQALILLDGDDGAADDATAVAALNTAAVDSILIDYAVTADGDNDEADLTATYKSESTTASEASITLNQAKALKQAYLSAIDDTNADSGAEDAFEAALLNSAGSYSATEDTALTKQVAPQDDMIGGSTLASKAVTGTVQGIISNRMASLRSGDAYYGAGMSAGNMTPKSGFLQAFGSEVEQKNTTSGSGTQYGYESSSVGFALGFDGTTDTGATVGLSFSMSNTDLDGKGTGKAKNDIDSYTASLYWDKTGQNGYVEGSLTYGLNQNSTSRIVNTAGLNRTYKGDYDSQQVSLSLGGGAPNAVGNNGYLTPFIGVTGTYIKTDAYTETSTTSGDNLRLRVAQDDVNSIVGKVGLKYHNVTDKGTPMISLSLNNEFGDDTINSTNTYQGGGSSFTTSTDVEPLSATLGLGYSYGSDTASINFAYEAEANDDKYLGHYGSIKFVGKF